VKARPIPEAFAPCAKTEKPAGNAGAAVRKRRARAKKLREYLERRLVTVSSCGVGGIGKAPARYSPQRPQVNPPH
jgi:hypothetical protein